MGTETYAVLEVHDRTSCLLLVQPVFEFDPADLPDDHLLDWLVLDEYSRFHLL